MPNYSEHYYKHAIEGNVGHFQMQTSDNVNCLHASPDTGVISLCLAMLIIILLNERDEAM